MKQQFDHISYAISKKITRHYSTSFSYGISLLAPAIRPHIYNIYGFVRLADEVVDSFHQFDKAALLSELKKETYLAIERGISVNPVLNSFQHTVHANQISTTYIDEFLNSMEMDLTKTSYTSDEYNQYILGSAEVVGLMCLQVFCKGDSSLFDQLIPYAKKLGSAFQKVNFLRDVQNDTHQLGRHYFPNVNIHNLSPKEKAEVEAEIEREFVEAYIGIRLLPANCRKGVYTAYQYYYNLLRKIKHTPAHTLVQKRIRINNYEKIRLLVMNKLFYKL